MKLKHRLVYILISLLYMSLIFYMSTRPHTSVSYSQAHRVLNNLFHIPIHGLLAYLILKWFSKVSTKTYAFTFLIVTFFGLFNEFFQSTVPGREGSFIDMGLNTIGMILCFLTVEILSQCALTNKG